MESIYLSIAGFLIRLVLKEPEEKAVKEFYKKNIVEQLDEFIVEGPKNKHDFTIRFAWGEKEEIIVRQDKKQYFIEFYKIISTNIIECYYQISFFQFLHVLYAALEQLLVKHNGFMVHASALGKEKVSLFVGKSGAGKTTIATMLGDIVPIRADDALAIRKMGNSYLFYQLPFFEKRGRLLKRSDPYELGTVYFLHKSATMKSTTITDNESKIERLLPQIYTSGFTSEQMRVIHNFVTDFPSFYKLSFPKEKKVVKQYFEKFL